MKILVIDVGTSSMRGILYDEGGGRLFAHRVTYSVTAGENGRVEEPASDWTAALTEICTAAAGHGVDALALTSQRSSIIPVDREGKPLRDAIMWQDTRNGSIVEELAPHRARIAALTGARLNTVFSATKMTWLRRNEPDTYEKTRKICTIADYLTWLITGSYVTDTTYGSRSLLMDLRAGQWSPELLSLFEVEGDKLCEIIPSGSVSGRVSRTFAEKTGLRAGLPLVSAGGDQQCGALGQGVVRPGAQAGTFGTGAFLIRASDSVPEGLTTDVICGAHAAEGLYALETSMLTCSSLFEWGRRTLFPEGTLEDLNRASSLAAPGAGGLILLPYLQGRGTPDWNSEARGVFLGVSLATTREEMARALVEAVALETVNSLETLDRYLGYADTLAIGGGFTKQPLFPQLLADASGRTVTLEKDDPEETARGAWMNAAAALGLYRDCAEAYGAAEKNETAVFTPRMELRSLYEERRAYMNRAYESLVGSVFSCQTASNI